MVGISVTPDGANLRVLRQQLHRRVHSLDKPLGGGRVCVAQMERLALEVPLEQRALGDWRQRLLRARRATSCRTRSVSFAVQGVAGPVKPFSTSAWSHSRRRVRSSPASNSRNPSLTTSSGEPYAPLLTLSSMYRWCRGVSSIFMRRMLQIGRASCRERV